MPTISTTDLERALIVNIKADIPTMISGPPGIGKSDLVKQVAKKLDYALIDFRATLRDPVDLRGLPMVDSKTGTSRWLPPSELPNVIRDGEHGILFLDELPQAHEAMQKACFSLVLDRYIGEYKLPPGWIPIAAGNRMMDRSGASRMNKALANRFRHYEVAPDIDSWVNWATKANVHPLVVAFIRFRPAFLFQMPQDDSNSFPTPRAWERVAKTADEPDPGLRFMLTASDVGEAAAGEFEAFARIWSRVPSIDAIMNDPKGVHVPGMEEPALLYAVASGLAKRVTTKSLAAVLTYAARFPSKEFEIMLVKDAIAREPMLKETKAFGNWFSKNSEIIT